MTKEDAALLEHERMRLRQNYNGATRGKAPMIAGAMQVAYSKGIEDSLTLLTKHGFTIERKKDVTPITGPETPDVA